MARIVVIRHPQKDGDKITAFGAQQAFAAAEALRNMGFGFKFIVWSGAHRTHQAALVMQAAIGGDAMVSDLPNDRFHFESVAQAVFPNDPKEVLAEMPAIREAGGTVDTALALSEYALEAGMEVANAIRSLGVLWGDADVLVVSHSPFLECAAVAGSDIPYGLGEADAVVYEVRGGEIVSSTLIKAPIQGATN